MQDSVTAVIIAFIFVCVVFPNIVRQKTKFYAALTCVIVVHLIVTLNALVGYHAWLSSTSLIISSLLQIAAILLLILAAGGLSWKQLLGEVNEAIDSVKRDATPPRPPTSSPPPVQPPAESGRIILTDSDKPA